MWKRYDRPDSDTDGYRVNATIDDDNAEVWLDTEASLQDGFHDGLCIGSHRTELAALLDAAETLSRSLEVVIHAIVRIQVVSNGTATTDVTDLPQGGECD